MGSRFRSFDEFWPFYLQEHARPATRAVHVAGTWTATMVLLVGVFLGPWWLVFLAPIIGSVRPRAEQPVWPAEVRAGRLRLWLDRGRAGIDCVACGSSEVTERPERTAQDYRRFRCRTCNKRYNERSGTVLNRSQYPSDVIALMVLWRLRYRLTLRDLAEMFLVRGIVLGYEAVREWEAKLTPHLAEGLRRRRHGMGGVRGRRWHVDETYLKVGGRWAYLYRAIDRDGHLVDIMLSEHRVMAAAQAFFRSAKAVTGVTPDQVTTDGHCSYPRTTRSTLGRDVAHRTSVYKNNRLEQDHRDVKGRTRCMRGFKSFGAAERFCRSYDELRNFLRPSTRHNQYVSARRRRLLHLRRASTALAILEVA